MILTASVVFEFDGQFSVYAVFLLGLVSWVVS